MKLKAAQIEAMTCPEGQKQTKVYDSEGLYLLIKQTNGDSTKKTKASCGAFIISTVENTKKCLWANILT